jgi:lipopolysaccharide/colanic/teichoic acid biosynthesis glycosyltransferase
VTGSKVHELDKRNSDMIKRAMDVLLSGMALLFLAPLGVAVSIILRCTGEGKIFYRQKRVGKGGEVFGLIKFATMLENSPNIGSGNITVGNDPRVLPFGRFLRKSKINELPQLWNIFVGDMSIVGPRPLTWDTYEMIPAPIRVEIRDITPGLTGAGSLIFRDEERYIAERPENFRDFYRDEIAPFKGELEIWYKKNRSFATDLKLIFLTAWVVVFPESRLPQRWLKALPFHAKFNPPGVEG